VVGDAPARLVNRYFVFVDERGQALFDVLDAHVLEVVRKLLVYVVCVLSYVAHCFSPPLWFHWEAYVRSLPIVFKVPPPERK